MSSLALGREKKPGQNIVYTRAYTLNRKTEESIQVRVNFLSDKTLRIFSADSRIVQTIMESGSYYPEKSLEKKMERAGIEYVGLLDDMNERMP